MLVGYCYRPECGSGLNFFFDHGYDSTRAHESEVRPTDTTSKGPIMKHASRSQLKFVACITAVLSAATFASAGDERQKTLEGPSVTATQPDGKGFSGNKEKKRPDAFAWLHSTLIKLAPTDEQKTQFKKMIEEQRQARDKWRTDHDPELQRIKEEFETAAKVKDKKRIEGLKDKANTLWATAPKFTELLAKLRQVLTPEQQANFDAAIQAKRDELKDDAANFFEDRPSLRGGPKKNKGDGKKGEEKQLSL